MKQVSALMTKQALRPPAIAPMQHALAFLPRRSCVAHGHNTATLQGLKVTLKRVP